MTPSSFMKVLVSVGCTSLLGLIAVVWSYNAGTNEKQDMNIRANEKSIQELGTKVLDLQYKIADSVKDVQMEMKESNREFVRSITALDNKVDELVNQKRRDNPSALPSH